MKQCTKDLSGGALDWAVAHCENEPMKLDPMGFGSGSPGGYWVWDDHGAGNPRTRYLQIGHKYSPSTNWAQGGPIIEREKLCPVWSEELQEWGVTKRVEDKFLFAQGPSFLIAAMRCFVASKFGDEIEIPKELQ